MSFDRLAPGYLALEFVLAGSLLQRCRTTFLDEVTGASKALLLGEGPGRYLLELLRVNPGVNVTCVDSSARMLAVADRQLRRRGLLDRRVELICADWAKWKPSPGAFDLVVTHFFLDCFSPDELAPLIAKVAALTTDGSRWVLTDFCEPPTGWQRARARLVLSLAYTFFRWTTGLSARRITPPDLWLQSAGFTLSKRQLFSQGLLHADLWRKGQKPI